MKKILLVSLLLISLSGCTNIFSPKTPTLPKVPKSNSLAGITQAFKNKYPDWDMKTVKININSEEGIYASGSVTMGMEGGIWLAYKESNQWKIVWDGNGTIGCKEIDPYGFPVDMVPECWDEKEQAMYDRVNENIISSTKTGNNSSQAGNQTSDKSQEQEKIKQAIDEHDNEMKATEVTFDKITDKLAKGSVSYPEGVGGWWLAVKENNQWKIIAVGSDVVDCAIIEPYNFPADMVTVCYNSQTNTTVNRVGTGNLDNILNDLKAATSVSFSSPQDVEFSWYEYTGEKKIKGRGFSISQTASSNLNLVEQFFKDNGYQMDMYNVADGTIVGSEGYMKDTIVCKVRQELYGGAAAMQLGESDLIIEVSCGAWTS